MTDPAFVFGDEDLETIRVIRRRYPEDRPRASILAVLHLVRDRFGCVPEETIPEVSGVLGVPRLLVEEVLSFQPLLRRNPPGEHPSGLPPLWSAAEGLAGSSDGWSGPTPGVAETRRLLGHGPRDGGRDLESYLRDRSGYEGLRKALDMEPARIAQQIFDAGLRDRGGSGRITGLGWSALPRTDPGRPRRMVCDAGGGDPGCFQDRVLLASTPHLLLEGCLIACFAVGAASCWIHVRGEHRREEELLEAALQEARGAGRVGTGILGSGFDCEIFLHRSAGSCLSGDEEALLADIEGHRGRCGPERSPDESRQLFGDPVLVERAETLANLPRILREGSEEFRCLGPEGDHGTRLFCVSGRVVAPGILEFPVGVPLRELLEAAGGPQEGHAFKAIAVGGSGGPILPARRFEGVPGTEWEDRELDPGDLSLDFSSLSEAGIQGAGSGFILLDDRDSVPAFLLDLVRFRAGTSCGHCTPCREGSHWVLGVLERLLAGTGVGGDLEVLESVAGGMRRTSRCRAADALALPVQSCLGYFRAEFETLLEETDSGVPEEDRCRR